jgi:hypothetical protein
LSHLALSDNFDVGSGPEAIALWQKCFASMPNLHSIALGKQTAAQAHTILASSTNLTKLTLVGTPLAADQELPIALKALELYGYVFNRTALPGIVERASRLPELEVLNITSSTYPASYAEMQFALRLKEGFPRLKELHFNDMAEFHGKPDTALLELARTLQRERPNLRAFVAGKSV